MFNISLFIFYIADNFRPYLTSFQGNTFTDYINAVFVDVRIPIYTLHFMMFILDRLKAGFLIIVCFLHLTGLHQTSGVYRHGMANQTHARWLLVAGLRLRVFGRRRPLPAAQRFCKYNVRYRIINNHTILLTSALHGIILPYYYSNNILRFGRKVDIPRNTVRCSPSIIYLIITTRT